MTALWIILAVFGGVIAGFGLCAALTVSREEQRRAARPPLGVQGVHPLEIDSRF